VAYARDVTGVHLDGNAAAWWPHAEGRYERGHKPEVGAILVFKAAGRMHVGHVAIVSRVVGPREVLVDQANWVRGRVTKAMSVVDASPLNDWTSVKVQFGGTHGRDNPTYGFIYPRAIPAAFEETVATAEPDKPRDARAGHAAAHAEHHDTAPDEEVAAYRHIAPRHIAERATHRKDANEHEAAAKTDPAAPRVTPAKHHEDAGEQLVAAQSDPAPQSVAAHVTHHKDRAAPTETKTDEAKTGTAPAAHQIAHAKHREDANDQEAAAQPDPAPQHVAAREARRKTHPSHDDANADSAAQPAQQLAAAAKLPVHKHKLPDARLAYVY
jgi:surface antigen